MDLDEAAFESKAETARKLPTGVEEPHTYGKRNWAFIPNYGERYRNGERIATGFVASALNRVMSKRMVKRQQRKHSTSPSRGGVRNGTSGKAEGSDSTLIHGNGSRKRRPHRRDYTNQISPSRSRSPRLTSVNNHEFTPVPHLMALKISSACTKRFRKWYGQFHTP